MEELNKTNLPKELSKQFRKSITVESIAHAIVQQIEESQVESIAIEPMEPQWLPNADREHSHHRHHVEDDDMPTIPEAIENSSENSTDTSSSSKFVLGATDSKKPNRLVLVKQLCRFRTRIECSLRRQC